MDRFQVESNTVLSCGIVITLVTSISYTFMDDLFMSFKIAFIRTLEPTVFTSIRGFILPDGPTADTIGVGYYTATIGDG